MARIARRRSTVPAARRVLRALLLLGLPIVVNGCLTPESLHILGPQNAAVGELTTFYVSTGTGCGKVFGGPSDPTAAGCPPSHGLAKLLDAACDGDACVVESVEPPNANDLIIMHVVGNTAGPTVLRVRAALDSGSQLSATSSVSFVTAKGLHVSCDSARAGDQLILAPFGQCGGLYPVFTSSSWKWTIMFESDSGPLGTFDPSFAVQGDAVTFDSASRWFQSGSTTGTAQVMISSRQFTKTVQVRVVSSVDVASGALRLVIPSDGIDQPIAQVGDAPTTLWYPPRNGRLFDGDTGTAKVMSSLTLADGSQAYGGGGLFASDHPEVCAPSALAPGANLLQQTEVQPECKVDGSATFAATIGTASITWPVTVTAPPGP